MPFQNEHSAMIAEQLPQVYAVIARKLIAPGVSVVLQRSKESVLGMKLQSYRFNKDRFSASEVKSWLKTHDVRSILFEPAINPSKKESKLILIDSLTKELAGAIIK